MSLMRIDSTWTPQVSATFGHVSSRTKARASRTIQASLDANRGLAHLFDSLLNFEGDGLALGDDLLETATAHDGAEGGLGALAERLADVGDAEGGAVRVGDVEDEDGVDLDADVVCRVSETQY